MQNYYTISSFYGFCEIDDTEALRLHLYNECKNLSILGTIIIAKEGVNATICGDAECINQMHEIFLKKYKINISQPNNSSAAQIPFRKMKIKIKPEIVTFNNIVNTKTEQTGEYIEPKDWDSFITQDNVILIDTRNYYEVAIGSFVNAIDPMTDNFTELVKWLDKNLQHYSKDQCIAMFCTGGIRCEKSTAYLKQKGFQKVFHLKGGILNYLSKTNNINGAWTGNCFVFDDRFSLDSNLHPCGNFNSL
ncbi:MAG: rhodanese-like domain-containing protein [Proteobacteria bacterium]|nr:rhodanese-like domain-containing protein [Pseudomonadota bacterium]